MTLPAGSTRTVRTINSADISDVEHFYSVYAHEPLIIQDVFPPDHPLCKVQLADIEYWFGEDSFRTYNYTTSDVEGIPPTEIFHGMRHDINQYNVVDHRIVGTPLGDLFTTPPYLSCNWFMGTPINYDEYEKNLILSPKGSFTSLHLDAYGMQGWVYLIAGCKVWEFYPPQYVHNAFDPIYREFFDHRKHSLEQFPLLALAEKYIGTMKAGDLLYFPSGWIHEVETTEISMGVGGALINDYQIEAHMYWCLWEQTFNLHHRLNLKQAILEMPPERFSSPQGITRSQAALQLCRDWELRTQAIEDVAVNL